jgi:hypothetical protein
MIQISHTNNHGIPRETSPTSTGILLSKGYIYFIPLLSPSMATSMHILHNKHHTSDSYIDFIPLLSPPTATSIYHIPPFLSYVYMAITSSHRWFHALYIVRHLGSPKRLKEHQFFHGIRAILSSRNFFFFFSIQPTQFFYSWLPPLVLLFLYYQMLSIWFKLS